MEPDLHVVALHYQVVKSASVTYLNPAAVEFETPEARFRLADGKLTVEMKAHYAGPEEARTVVEPVLRAWEAHADLLRNRGELRFVLNTADVIDRSPAPSGTTRGFAFTTISGFAVAAVGQVTPHVGCATYPTPPGAFRLTPDAESVLQRYEGYLDGKEPLLAMAYFALTVLDTSAGNRRDAAVRYQIDYEVLRKVGELTTVRGDRTSARKAKQGAVQALTGAERAWLEATIKTIIRRLGESHVGSNLSVIRMSDLPRL
jgi:hypothetical protein